MGHSDLTDQERISWSRFLTSLLSRTPEAVALFQERGKVHFNDSFADRPEEYEAVPDASDPPTLTEWVDAHVPGLIENFGQLSLPGFIVKSRWVEKLLRMNSMLWDFSRQNNHLLLSDRPCIITSDMDDLNFVLALPIGPWKAFKAIKTEPVASIVRTSDPRTVLLRMNKSAVANARMRVHGRDASHRRLIANRLGRLRCSATATGAG